MKSRVEFVSLDPQGVITRETWQVTKLHCPRCGIGKANVWGLVSQPPLKAGGHVLPIYLCVSCQFVALGLGGFKPQWDQLLRSQQIIQQAFQNDSEDTQ